jgi:hypothetical protein
MCPFDQSAFAFVHIDFLQSGESARPRVRMQQRDLLGTVTIHDYGSSLFPAFELCRQASELRMGQRPTAAWGNIRANF